MATGHLPVQELYQHRSRTTLRLTYLHLICCLFSIFLDDKQKESDIPFTNFTSFDGSLRN